MWLLQQMKEIYHRISSALHFCCRDHQLRCHMSMWRPRHFAGFAKKTKLVQNQANHWTPLKTNVDFMGEVWLVEPHAGRTKTVHCNLNATVRSVVETFDVTPPNVHYNVVCNGKYLSLDAVLQDEGKEQPVLRITFSPLRGGASQHSREEIPEPNPPSIENFDDAKTVMTRHAEHFGNTAEHENLQKFCELWMKKSERSDLSLWRNLVSRWRLPRQDLKSMKDAGLQRFLQLVRDLAPPKEDTALTAASASSGSARGRALQHSSDEISEPNPPSIENFDDAKTVMTRHAEHFGNTAEHENLQKFCELWMKKSERSDLSLWRNLVSRWRLPRQDLKSMKDACLQRFLQLVRDLAPPKEDTASSAASAWRGGAFFKQNLPFSDLRRATSYDLNLANGMDSCWQNSCLLPLPGHAFEKKILVSLNVVETLLHQHCIEEIESDSKVRNFAWVAGSTANWQWESLLRSMPPGKQKTNLKNKFGHAISLDQPAREPVLTQGNNSNALAHGIQGSKRRAESTSDFANLPPKKLSKTHADGGDEDVEQADTNASNRCQAVCKDNDTKRQGGLKRKKTTQKEDAKADFKNVLQCLGATKRGEPSVSDVAKHQEPQPIIARHKSKYWWKTYLFSLWNKTKNTEEENDENKKHRKRLFAAANHATDRGLSKTIRDDAEWWTNAQLSRRVITNNQSRKRLGTDFLHYELSVFLVNYELAFTHAVYEKIRMPTSLAELAACLTAQSQISPFGYPSLAGCVSKPSPSQFLRHLALVELHHYAYCDLPLDTAELLQLLTENETSRRATADVVEDFAGAVKQHLQKYAACKDNLNANCRFLFPRAIASVGLESELESLIDKAFAFLEVHRLQPKTFEFHRLCTICVFHHKLVYKPSSLKLGTWTPLLQQRKPYITADQVESCEKLAMHTVPKDVADLITTEKQTMNAFASTPIVCQLCHQSFLGLDSLQNHCKEVHGNFAEYRKRLFFKAEQAGHQPLRAWVKRSMIQSFSFFQTHSIPGSRNDWLEHSMSRAEPRRMEACVFCAVRDWLETRFPIYLFQEPTGTTSLKDQLFTAGSSSQSFLEMFETMAEDTNDKQEGFFSYRGCFCLGPREKVNDLLSVQAYAALQPHIPVSELFASSICHPDDGNMHWLLHSKRVPPTGTKKNEGAILRRNWPQRQAGLVMPFLHPAPVFG